MYSSAAFDVLRRCIRSFCRSLSNCAWVKWGDADDCIVLMLMKSIPSVACCLGHEFAHALRSFACQLPSLDPRGSCVARPMAQSDPWCEGG